MSLWFWVIVACVIGFLTKLLGYLLPRKWLTNPRVARVAGILTIGLLASLTIANTVATGQQLALDARIDARVYAALSVEASVAARASYGGTAPDAVRARVAEARAALGSTLFEKRGDA